MLQHPRTRRTLFSVWVVSLVMVLFLCGGTLALAQTPPPGNSSTTTQSDTAEHHLTAPDGELDLEQLNQAQVDELQNVLKGAVTPEQLAQLKTQALSLLEEKGTSLIQRLDDRFIQKQDQRLTWLALVIILALPLLAFIGFMLYPLLARKSINRRVPGIALGRFYRLYIVQAIVVTVVLLLLGSCLWGIQYMTSRLGGFTNPQLVLQKESIRYVIDNREELLNDYTDVMLALARDISNNPDEDIPALILENARQLKDDPLINASANIANFVSPFLSYLSLVTFSLLVLFFLIRIFPDVKNMLTYPIEMLEAEQQGRSLPQFSSNSKAVPAASASVSGSAWVVGRWLMWMEVKVIALFAVCVLVLATLLGFLMLLFYEPIVGLLVSITSLVAETFLRSEVASNIVIITTVIVMLFVIECVAVFLVAFIFATIRFQEAIRQYFAKNITRQQTQSFLGRALLRFGWVILLTTVLGMLLPFADEKLSELLFNNGKEPNLFLIFTATPLVLLVGINLGLWLLRGFKTLVNLFKKSAAAEFGLKKPKIKKEPVLAAGD